jgi:hypothetical protein
MEHVARVTLWLSLLIPTAFAPAGGQENICSKLLLLPLRDRSFEVSQENRADLNLYQFCSATAWSEAEARDGGFDLPVIYTAAGVALSDPTRSQKLAAWQAQHCPEYAKTKLPQLKSALSNIIQKAGPQLKTAYDHCLAPSVGLSCYAAPAGKGAISLVLAWRPAVATSQPPELLEVRVKGAAAPDDLLDGRFRSADESDTVLSMQHLMIPAEGLLRGLLRLDRDAEVSVSATTTVGTCVTEKVSPEERTKGVYQIEPVNGKCDQDGCSIERNSDIWVSVSDLQRGLDALAGQKQLPDKAGVADLVPVIDGIPIAGVHPVNPEGSLAAERLEEGQLRHRLLFHLERIDTNDANRKAWSRLLARPVLKRPVDFTLGFENGASLYTWLTKDATESSKRVQLIVLPQVTASFGVIIIGGALIVFLALAGRTDLIRDTTARRNPDGRSPLSLARAQMAFWFFLVAASYLGLWMITGDKNTITTSVLTLIGISAGTALGAAIVDAGKTSPEEVESDVITTTLADKDVLDNLRKEEGAAREALRVLREEADKTILDTAAKEANHEGQERKKYDLARLARQIAFFSQRPWRRALNDLLSDNGVIGFHRFQIFVWTLVLGVIFSAEVFSQLSMPEFSSTLLAIMGISGGTYIGFKIPEVKSGATAER